MMKLKLLDVDVRFRTEGRALNSRVYVFFKPDDCSVPFCHAAGDIRKQLMPSILREMGLPQRTRVRFSAYAGCQCGCSPGFIVEDNAGVEAKEVFVEAKITR